jgi:hypothetical protein
MERDAAAADSSLLRWSLVQAGISHHRLTGLCPGFLVISPPKTGSTWLAANLRCHPQLFVPDIKEVKYFSSFFKRMDLSWYLDNFRAGAGRLCGEASPSYALLPVDRIRLIRRLMPDVKLIFLMRDPIARAWSHARHNHRYREANFATCSAEFAAVPDAMWQANFRHDWPLASGDYLGQLRRWLTVFPREQIYVGFYEAIAAAPERLLREIFAFLGVDAELDLSRFRVKERILAGRPGELSVALLRCLHRLLHGRTVELVSFLKDRFALEPPPQWQATLAPQPIVGTDLLVCPVPGQTRRSVPTFSPESQPEVFRRDQDEAFVCHLLAYEEEFPSARCAVDEYRGHDVVYRRGLLYAFDQTLGPPPSEQATGREVVPPPGFTLSSWRANLRVEEFSQEQHRRWQDEGRCVIALSLPELKAGVDHQLFRKLELRLQVNIQETQERIAVLESRLADAELALRRVEADLYPKPIYAAVGILRKIYRRLRAALLPT